MRKTFAIIGLGRFGSTLAKELMRGDAEVLVMDKDPNKVNEVAEYVTHAIIGDSTDERTLDDLGIRNFDYVVISLANDIRASVITTVLCKELGANYIIAKAVDDLHAKLLEKTGADKIIQPERDAGARLARNLMYENILDYLELSDEYSIQETKIPERWVGKNLVDLDLRKKNDVSVIAIRRDEDLIVTIDPSEALKKNDILIMMGSNKGLTKVRDL